MQTALEVELSDVAVVLHAGSTRSAGARRRVPLRTCQSDPASHESFRHLGRACHGAPVPSTAGLTFSPIRTFSERASPARRAEARVACACASCRTSTRSISHNHTTTSTSTAWRSSRRSRRRARRACPFVPRGLQGLVSSRRHGQVEQQAVAAPTTSQMLYCAQGARAGYRSPGRLRCLNRSPGELSFFFAGDAGSRRISPISARASAAIDSWPRKNPIGA